MKKIIFLLILILLTFTIPSFATDYYACQTGQNINGDATWCTAAHRNGSCSGDGTYEAGATVLAGTHTLHANGCAAIVINTSVTATKITNKTDGTGTDGGQFTLATATGANITAVLETGATTDLLSISGSQAGTPVLTIIATTATAGSATGIDCINSTHTVGTIAFQGTPTGGTSSTAHAINYLGASGGFAITGSPTQGTGYGLVTSGSGSASTVAGNCIGSDSAYGFGCQATGAGTITVTGNIVNGTRGAGAVGSIVWTPAADDYVLFKGGTDVYASQAPNKAKVLSDTSVVIATTGAYEAGTATEGGGGAWGF